MKGLLWHWLVSHDLIATVGIDDRNGVSHYNYTFGLVRQDQCWNSSNLSVPFIAVNIALAGSHEWVHCSLHSEATHHQDSKVGQMTAGTLDHFSVLRYTRLTPLTAPCPKATYVEWMSISVILIWTKQLQGMHKYQIPYFIRCAYNEQTDDHLQLTKYWWHKMNLSLYLQNQSPKTHTWKLWNSANQRA